MTLYALVWFVSAGFYQLKYSLYVPITVGIGRDTSVIHYKVCFNSLSSDHGKSVAYISNNSAETPVFQSELKAISHAWVEQYKPKNNRNTLFQSY